MKQHLSDPLHKYLERLVEKEAWDKWWAELPPSKLIELKKIEITRDSVGWWNIVRQALSELRP